MRRSRITITLNKHLLEETDKLVDEKSIRNRSHAIEFIISQYLTPNVKKAVILAGGKGTKLRPYTYEIPKSLLPIKGKPLLEYTIENLKNNGISEIIICVGYLGEKIREHFGDGKRYSVKIIYSQEKESVQTGGALLMAKKLLNNNSFILIHGDILTNLPLKDLIDFHKHQKTPATIALTTVNEPTDFGQLKLHGTKLVNFYQKKHDIKSNLVNCGIYVFEPQIFDYFPKNEKNFLLEDIIEKLINEKKVSGYVFEDQWFDVGTPKNYENAIKQFKISRPEDQK